ncbi:MAG TPA: formimidoylglutamate deiminase [Acidimicrobiales bacterium]|nr:formimidoylglutamate deiminase [Acidimicrobiales bacterium]
MATSASTTPLVDYYCDYAWLGGDTATSGVTLRVKGTRIEAVTVAGHPPAGARHLAGLTLPGLANAHSHAFHRALRGRAERGQGDFWTWRDLMYSAAAVLTPELYFALARAVYAEMALAGFTVVGEFHYLHHGPGGARYDDANAMGRALREAGRAAGVKLVLIDACYLEAGPGRPLEGAQLRFGDEDVEAWAERAAALAGAPRDSGELMGAAVHSLRAVPPAAVCRVAEWAQERSVPLHFHCSEQPAENLEVLAAYGATPVALLGEAGALRQGSVAVHATHLCDEDVKALGQSGAGVCMCPTTERDLADGIGPARRLLALGAPLSLGSDSHAVVNPFEEMRALEVDERLATHQRGHFSAAQLLEAATSAGYRALGDPAGGRLRPGAPADFVALSLDGPGLAGTTEEFLLEGAVFAAAPSDVTGVVVEGRPVVEDGRHLLVDDVAGALRSAIGAMALPLS